jgi:tRNA-Thr(GGU) m(6)t(6)A37 methyltransferase TsaA
MIGKAELRFIGKVEKADEEETLVNIYPEYCDGLRGIEAFSHLIILYWAHLRDNDKERQTLLVFPRKHQMKAETGVFACRSPSRPNPISLCVVRLLRTEGCNLVIKGLDAFAGTPIIDIKPYLPRADLVSDASAPEWSQHGPPT